MFEVLLLLHVGGQLLGLVLVEHSGGDVILPVRLGLRLVHVDMQVLLANVDVAGLLMVAGVFRLLLYLTLSLEAVTEISEQLRLLQILRLLLLLRLGRDLVLEAGDRVSVLLVLVLLGGALDHLVKLHPQLLSDVLGELLICSGRLWTLSLHRQVLNVALLWAVLLVDLACNDRGNLQAMLEEGGTYIAALFVTGKVIRLLGHELLAHFLYKLLGRWKMVTRLFVLT